LVLLPPAQSEAVDAPMPDSHEPDLRVRAAGEQLFGRLECLIGDFEIACIDVDRHDSAVIAAFDLRTDLLLVDLRSTASVFFFGQSRLSDAHGGSIST
jgi:hypothetical protein